MDHKEIFSTNLKIKMEKAGKTRRDVCRDLGFSYYTLTDWVKGKKMPRMDKVEILANYFNCLISDLIEEKTEEQLDTQKKDDITFDDFTYAMYNETKDLTDEDKEALLSMARILKKKTKN